MKFELIDPQDKQGFHALSEIRKIYETTGRVTFRNDKGEIKTFTKDEPNSDWEAVHAWLTSRSDNADTRTGWEALRDSMSD